MRCEAKPPTRFVRALGIALCLCGGLATSGCAFRAFYLSKQGASFRHQGDYDAAIERHEQAIGVQEFWTGEGGWWTGYLYQDFGITLEDLGRFEDAERMVSRALEIHRTSWSPNHWLWFRSWELSATSNMLGVIYVEKGDLARAEELFRAAIRYEDHWYRRNGFLADPISSLGGLALRKGNASEAETLYRRSLELERNTWWGGSPDDVASKLNNVANAVQRQGRHEEARELLEEAIQVVSDAYGPDHPDVASSLEIWAWILVRDEEFDPARHLILRARRIREQATGMQSPSVASNVFLLAGLERRRGDREEARRLDEEALAIFEASVGKDHPGLAPVLNVLATSALVDGDLETALARQRRYNQLRERGLALNLWSGSEGDKAKLLGNLRYPTYATVSVHTRFAPEDPDALRLAFETVIQRKGRVLDSMSDYASSLRRRLAPEDRAELDRLRDLRASMARIALGGARALSLDERRARLEGLDLEAEALERSIATRSLAFRTASVAPTLEEIQKRLPEGSALVEYTAYKPWDPRPGAAKRWGTMRYLAYVIRPDAEPAWVDLGPSRGLVARLHRLRPKLADPTANVQEGLRLLHDRLVAPLDAHLGGVRHLLIAPEASLNLLPFGALLDEQGRHLAERVTISYLTSGRDLLRLDASSDPRSVPLVVGAPSFGARLASSASDQRRSVDFSAMHFGALPGTAEEVDAIGRTLPDADVRVGDQATETLLKRASAPRILHIATHGFFLTDQGRESEPAERGLAVVDPAAGTTALVDPAAGASALVALEGENPLLRSGLALAGANDLRGGDGEDGILTALEASDLDLWGTEMVVLSACETGVGTVSIGEGVHGLRRSLAVAGSESQVISLWKVDDVATKDLMVQFYARLAEGQGRAEALRNVQLAMLADPERSHPYYWAGFVGSGAWGPLSEAAHATR